MCQDSSVSKVTGFKLDCQSSITSRGRDFPPCHNVHTDSETHPTYNPVGKAGRVWCKPLIFIWYWVKYVWNCTSTPLIYLLDFGTREILLLIWFYVAYWYRWLIGWSVWLVGWLVG